MAPFNLNANSMFPVYGLAEASLAVSFPKPGSTLQTVHLDRQQLKLGQTVKPIKADTVNAVELVATGHPVADCDMGIFFNDQPVEHGIIGHIKIRGGNVTQGYYQDPEKTAAVINQAGWLDTGDLGFIYQDNLFIVGRSKELIIINGQNFATHDLEKAASNAELSFEKIVACSVLERATNSEQLILFVLFKNPVTEFIPLAKEIMHRVSLNTGIAPAHVLPITKIPKTTSGKVQRYQLVERFYQGEFNDIIRQLNIDQRLVPPQQVSNSIERKLLNICHNHLKNAIGVHDNIFDTGTSSLTLAQIFEDIDQQYPGAIEVTDIFDYPTIAELSSHIDSKLTGSKTHKPVCDISSVD